MAQFSEKLATNSRRTDGWRTLKKEILADILTVKSFESEGP